MTPRAETIRNTRLLRVVWCCTCNAEVTITPEESRELKAGQLHPGIGPFHHLSVFPDHYVIEVRGELTVWRDTF